MRASPLRTWGGHELHGLAAAYVLDALPADEDRIFDHHLEVCEVCRLEVDELRETVARLGLGASSAPPPQLRSQVLRRASALRQLRPQSGEGRAAGSGPGRRILAPLAAAAAAAAITFGIVDARPAPQLDAAVVAVLAAEDTRRVALEAPGGARANLHHSASHDRLVLVVDGLEELPGGAVYEVWSYRDGSPAAAGLLALDEQGRGAVALPPGAEDSDAVAITVEPDGGSPAPSGRVVAQGPLS